MNEATTRPIPCTNANAPRRAFAWLLAAALAAAATTTVPNEARATDAPPVTASVSTRVFPPGAVVKTRDFDVTRADLSQFAKLAGDKTFSDDQIASFENVRLQALLDHLTISMFVGQRYVREGKPIAGVRLDEAAVKEARRLERHELSQRYAQEIAAKVPEPTKEEIAAYYEENGERFVVPLVFSMRQIFVSTYEKVHTKEGDTLPGLAKRIAGDENAVGLILVDNDAKSPRAPDWTPENPGITKPLEAGEDLLVPLSAEGKKKPEARIRAALKRLEQGENFEKVAAECSDAGTGEMIENLPMTGRPLLPQFVEVAKATAPGKLSKVFETKHGYNIVRIESKTEDKKLKLDEVAPQIASVLLSEARDKALAKATDELLARPGVEVHYAALKAQDNRNAKEKSRPSDIVVATVDGTPITMADLTGVSFGSISADTPDAEILRTLHALPVVREYLFAPAALQAGLHKPKEAQIALAAKAYRDLARVFDETLKKRIADQEISEEEARKFYAENKGQFGSPATCSFYILAVEAGGTTGTAVVPPEVAKIQKHLTELVAGVKTAEEFRKVAMENTTASAIKESGCLAEKAPLAQLPTPLAQALGATAVGAMTEALYVRPSVLVAWVLEHQEPRGRNFDEAKDEVVEAIRLRHHNEAFGQARKEMIEELGLEMQ